MNDGRQVRVALLVAGCFFMENLDGTIVTTSAPRIGRALHVAPSQIGFVITAYLLTLAVFIPLGGWLTTRWGARPVFLSAIAIFTLSSLACAVSGNLGELIAMRVLQGVGGAMMVPVGRLVVLSTAAKTDLIRMIAYIVWPGLVAPVIAPLAGGLITTYATWRWLFFINVPLGAIALIIARRLIVQTRPAVGARLDLLGLALTGTGLAGVTYATHLLSQSRGSSLLIAGLGCGSLLFLAIAVFHLRRTDMPLVNLGVLRVSTFRASTVGSCLFLLTVGAVPFLLPLLFENVFRWSPVKAGTIVMALFLGNIAIKPATGFLLRRFGFRTNLVTATSLLAGTTVAAGFIEAQTPLVLVGALVVVGGAARSLGMTCYMTMAMGDVPADQMSDANTLAVTGQQLSTGLGIALATIALRAGGALGHVSHGNYAAGAYTVAFTLMALAAAAATVSAARLHPSAGSAVLGSTPTAVEPEGDRAAEHRAT